MDNWFNIFPILLILAALLGVFLFETWRRQVVSLAALYLGMFILMVQVNSLALSSAKLISGWMAALLLGLIVPKVDFAPEEGLLSNQVFKIAASVFIWMIGFFIARSVGSVFSTKPEIVFISLAIFGSGMLQLGMKAKPLQVILGVLLIFAGFDLLYSSIETSVLINGLLAAMNLLIALLGTFFENRVSSEEEK